MPNIDTIIDGLRELSEPMHAEDAEELEYIQQQSIMIGEIFGFYGPKTAKKAKKSKEKKVQTEQKKQEGKIEQDSPTALLLGDGQETTEEKRRQFEEKRRLFEAKFPNAVSQERRANAREILNSIVNNLGVHSSTLVDDLSTAQAAFNMISSRSWISGLDSEDKSMATDFDLAFSSTSESVDTLLDETSTPINSPLGYIPVNTCTQ